jgi:hypothetical protein
MIEKRGPGTTLLAGISRHGTALLLAPPLTCRTSRLLPRPEPRELADANGLTARTPKPGAAAEAATPRRLSPAELQREVLLALWGEPILRRSSIGVLTLDGVVILTGYAYDEADAELAERLAYAVGGVHWVLNHLAIRHPVNGRHTCASGALPSTPF